MKILSSKIKFLSFLFTLFSFYISFPSASQANQLWYGNILNVNEDTATIELRGLENKNYFTCSITSLECNTLPELPKIFPKADTTSNENSPKIIFPLNSTRQKISKSGRFGFYIIANPSKETKTFGLIDGKKNKKYTIVNNLKFWNLIEEQPTASRFSKDDSSMTYISDRSGFMSLYVVPLNSLSQKTFLGTKITTDVSVGDFLYADNNTILYIANTKKDPYNWILYSYDIKKKTRKILAQNLTYDSNLYQYNNSILFTELTSLGTAPKILTNYKDGEIKDFKIPITNPENIDSISYSYQKIAGMDTVLMKNIKSEAPSHPLIVWLHGGPYRQSSFKRHAYISYGVYDWALEEAVNKGDAYVLKIDYPGSYGSGKALTEKIKNGVGTTDIKSVMNVINSFTKDHKNISKIYTVGNSYGGYITSKAMVSYPKQIDGGISINGVTDWKSLLILYKNSIFNTFFGGLPNSKNKNLFTKASVINNVNLIKNPLYIIQGEKDRTIPKSQATLLKNILDASKKESTLIMIPEEDHVFKKNSSIVTICKTIFEMLDLDSTNSCNLEG